MSLIVRSPSPKARFQESKDNVSKHRDLVQMRDFERAIDFALLQYQSELSRTPLDNFNIAAGAHFRMLGAQEFVRVLRLLAETYNAPTSGESQELDYKA